MRAWLGVALGIGLLQPGACGPGLSSQPAPSGPPAPTVRAGVPPPSDEGALRKLLVGDVASGGLWFADATCEAQFGQPITIKPASFDAFAHCVAGLHLRPTGRGDAFDDTSVLTDDAGFELEARVTAGRLDFLGFSGRAPGTPELPSITPDALESLRTGGDRNATISAFDASAFAKQPGPRHAEHLRLCVTDSGDLSVIPATTMMTTAAAAFSAVTRSWRFRPFFAGGKPMAVCAIVAFDYPGATRDSDRLPAPPQFSKAGHLVYFVPPIDLEPLRVAGTKNIVPDDTDKAHLWGRRLQGSFKLCLDETGHYERGEVLQSTGVPGYDARIARTLMTEWAYRPTVVDGVAIPVCTAITFIYTQH